MANSDLIKRRLSDKFGNMTAQEFAEYCKEGKLTLQEYIYLKYGLVRFL